MDFFLRSVHKCGIGSFVAAVGSAGLTPRASLCRYAIRPQFLSIKAVNNFVDNCIFRALAAAIILPKNKNEAKTEKIIP